MPAWCTKATIAINGKTWRQINGNQVVTIQRSWRQGDVVELRLPMHVFTNTWYENSMSVERGPLTFALKIKENVTEVVNKKDPLEYGQTYYEVRPANAWNYALLQVAANKLETQYTFETARPVSDFPWNLENCPVVIKTKALRMPSWQLYNEMAGPVPYSISYGAETAKDAEEVILVPYGCTQLRIAQFPVTGGR